MSQPPTPPEGHKQPRDYTESVVLPQVLNVVLAVILTAFLFPGFLSKMSLKAMGGLTEIQQYLGQYGLLPLYLVLILVASLVVHESIHWISSYLLGYSPQFGHRLIDPHVSNIHQFVLRQHNILFLSAPFIIISIFCLIGWLVPSVPPVIDYFCRGVLVLNTAGSSGDLYNISKVWRTEPGSLFYNYECESGMQTAFYPPENKV